MEFNLADPTGALYPDGCEMRRAMIAISEHTEDRGREVNWSTHLRFLTADRMDFSKDSAEDVHGGPLSSYDEPSASDADSCSDQYCSCNNCSVVFRHDRSLRLTAPTEAPDCCHYIAISYCWADFPKSTSFLPYSITEANGIQRGPRCSWVLLHRVLQYAT